MRFSFFMYICLSMITGAWAQEIKIEKSEIVSPKIKLELRDRPIFRPVERILTDEEKEQERLNEIKQQNEKIYQAHYQNILKQFKNDEIIGLEYLLAGKSSDLESRFGHSLIRLVSKRGWRYDYTLSLVADIPSGQISYMKGIFGGYDFKLDISTFQATIESYVFNQRRGLDRYIIPTTKEQLDQFYQLIVDYVENREIGGYAFFNKNCASASVVMLQTAGILIDPNDATIFPARVDDVLTRSVARRY